MLEIRSDQMSLFEAAGRKAFIDRMVARVRARFQHDFRNDMLRGNNLDVVMDEVVERSFMYGISREQDVERYIDCSVELGFDFDSQAIHIDARMILERNDLSGTEKISLIVEYLIFRSR